MIYMCFIWRNVEIKQIFIKRKCASIWNNQIDENKQHIMIDVIRLCHFQFLTETVGICSLFKPSLLYNVTCYLLHIFFFFFNVKVSAHLLIHADEHKHIMSMYEYVICIMYCIFNVYLSVFQLRN